MSRILDCFLIQYRNSRVSRSRHSRLILWKPGRYCLLIDHIEERLKKDGWERLVLVKEEDERTIMSVKPEGDKVAGFIVMTLEPGDEASFVNIIGTIDFKSFSEMDINLDQSVLDSLKKHMGKDE